jgi:hypothetical protein
MNSATSKLIARHLREVHFGGNWTWSNLKDNLAGLTWQQATTKIHEFNTIAALVFHINYFVRAGLMVLRGGSLNAHDKFSFDVPPIQSQEGWDKFLEQIWADAEEMAQRIEQLPDSKLSEIFSEEKYGTFHRNFLGVIEHAHYHLGQIAVIKKMLPKA